MWLRYRWQWSLPTFVSTGFIGVCTGGESYGLRMLPSLYRSALVALRVKNERDTSTFFCCSPDFSRLLCISFYPNGSGHPLLIRGCRQYLDPYKYLGKSGSPGMGHHHTELPPHTPRRTGVCEQEPRFCSDHRDRMFLTYANPQTIGDALALSSVSTYGRLLRMIAGI